MPHFILNILILKISACFGFRHSCFDVSTKKPRNRESNWFCAQFLEFPEVYSSRSQNTHRKKFQTPNFGILFITSAL